MFFFWKAPVPTAGEKAAAETDFWVAKIVGWLFMGASCVFCVFLALLMPA